MESKYVSKTLFVGNLHASLEENDLLNVFKPFGTVVECCKKWCHYGFIQFATDAEARLAYSNLNGSKLRGRSMRIEFQRKKIKNIQALIEAEIQNSHMNYENMRCLPSQSNNVLTESELMTFFDTHSSSTQSSESLSLNGQHNQHLAVDVNTFAETISLNEINNNFEDLIKKIMSQDATNFFDSASSSMSLASSSSNSSSSSSSTSSLFNIGHDETRRSEHILRPLQLNINDAKSNKVKGSGFMPKFNLTSFSENNKENRLDSGEISSNINFESSTNALKSAFNKSNSCKNLLFKSINSSNTIFIQPHDVLTPLNEGDFHEYKLFPIIQN